MIAFPDRRPPLRILHTESSCGWGGQEMRILSEAAGLLARGHHVRLACPPQAPIYDAARERGIPVLALPIAQRNWRALAAARAALRRHPVHVINTHSSTDSWLFALAARTLGDRPGIVRTRHISAPPGRDPFTRWIYGRGADLLVTTGRRLRQDFLERHGLPAERVVSVPTGIDTDHFTPGDRRQARAALGLPADRVIAGIAATIRSWKGHLDLLDALALTPQKDNLLLLVVGDGPSRRLVEERIVQCGLTGKVRMVGQQPDVAPWLQALDLFVLPSYANEGVPQSITQAMSCGLPVLSTPVGSIAEAVAHEETGLLAPPRNPPALASALARLAGDADLRVRMGEAGRRAALARFTLGRMLDRMEDVFHRVARGAPCRRPATAA